ncbi:hypothetical protein AB0J74_36955 [Asanoa sp. NPDC049573]|uniref:hypothetical protein n=1 Tax=Asanoa sp. NPDC049573 TaxID=3155396 RepID=UPI00343D7395
MSFDLVVVAIDPAATPDDVRAMVERCRGPWHPDGEPDPRIVAFYTDLRSTFPDRPPLDDASPWTGVPLDAGIDHVVMCISYSPVGTRAVELVVDLAEKHGLVLWDPQLEEAFAFGD